jgi:hypothetical protein
MSPSLYEGLGTGVAAMRLERLFEIKRFVPGEIGKVRAPFRPLETGYMFYALDELTVKHFALPN